MSLVFVVVLGIPDMAFGCINNISLSHLVIHQCVILISESCELLTSGELPAAE